MKGEFLLEIGTEEIPASFIPPATQSFCELFGRLLDNARISYSSQEWYATPRRLIFRALDVAPVQSSVEIEKTGPAKSAAFDEHGNPTKAAEGFARSQGVNVKDLLIVSTSKGEQVAVRKREEGRPTVEVLSEELPVLLEKISFPKTMRWMGLDVRFARPVHWIVALFEGQVIPFSFGNIQTGNSTRGHRFTNPGNFAVSGFDQFRDSLENHGVVIDPGRRRSEISRLVQELAASKGLKVFEEPDLLDEITYLVESPYPVMGEFSADFLELPASILITCMKKHQRYFSVQDDGGRITNRFIAVNNTPVQDPQMSLRGHQRVLKARLEDARFYFREDRKVPLMERLEALKGVVFHSKLGTAHEKVERFTELAMMLAKKLAPDKVDVVKHASLLCKCDLETGIVYEFPELQGIIGSYYAKMDGEPEEVSTAVREHYLPAFAGDSLPKGIVGSLVSIADRMDTIAGCFSVGLIPTGAADPYGLRRNALGIIQILMNLDRPVDLPWLIREAVKLIGDKRTRGLSEVEADVLEFFRTRFVNFHTSREFSLDVVEAVVRARFDDVVDARRRVEALNQWKMRPDFDSIMIGFKRVVNILKNVEPTECSPDLFQEESEKQLFSKFQEVAAQSAPLIDSGNYAKALELMTELKAPIDTLFDKVMVMVEDEQLRNNRLGLLRKIADFFIQIADFSFIGSTAK
ncbi:glycine--tRNA ligase subunit beta [Desulfomonile tiedjei]|uniref:Glycine--tRNA ligase beta subunit n=1 Tax=Desulfomonile tiedjei (strain ATCC 49306 / DSM 6799 / DCB-1) TaxID=706587 RepID=I4CAN5_DESTA|nr:glycine--tRNA ligase subunit beta [Desulfomonile tiedjei]AFM26626.1 glycyl-tRNA synthetase beta chain [Desulfomonile tiedjei DSM 6799]